MQHEYIQCNLCQQEPLVGIRFRVQNSSLLADGDLCEECYDNFIADLQVEGEQDCEVQPSNFLAKEGKMNETDTNAINTSLCSKTDKAAVGKSFRTESDRETSIAALRVRDGLRGTLRISRQEFRRRFGYQFDALDHPLAAAELPVHRYRCSACLAYPIVGARIQCLDCIHHAAGVHFCQKCFFSRKVSYDPVTLRRSEVADQGFGNVTDRRFEDIYRVMKRRSSKSTSM